MARYRSVRHVGFVRALVAVTASATALAVLPAVAAGAGPRTAARAATPVPSATSPVVSRAATTVTADALPTVQIDGVVWSQTIVGDTVYAGGSFANARPAGAAPDTQLVPRSNLLAYDLRTGELIPSFDHTIDAQVQSVTKSPDGSRLYIGGSFTTVDGQHRYRIAAFDTATGALIGSFAPSLDASVTSISATNSTVYVGGVFGTANGVARSRLAAFSAATGALLGWAPTTDDVVNSILVTPDHSAVVIGGTFRQLDGTDVFGIGAVGAGSGTIQPWAVNKVVHDFGGQAGILSLTTDGKAVYGTGYVSRRPGNLEGTFSADPDTGKVNWIENCRGDSYSSYSDDTTVYVVSHAHSCTDLNGFPDAPTSQPPFDYHRSTAFTVGATGTLPNTPPTALPDLAGLPSPSLMDWFPDIDSGIYTGQDQGSWTVTGKGPYIVEGGEFRHVNGVPQQGLVRFARASIAPRKRGPQVSDHTIAPTVTVEGDNVARVSWLTNWDPDDRTLTYRLYRSGSSAPIYQVQADSEFWNRPTLTFVSAGLNAGTSYGYRVDVTDPSGNLLSSPTTAATTTVGSPQHAYALDALRLLPSHYWRLGERRGHRATDRTRSGALLEGSGVVPAAAGALIGDPDTAAVFDGTSNGRAAAAAAEPPTPRFSVTAWIRTRSKTSGQIVGFANRPTGSSTAASANVYLDDSGRVVFGVRNGSAASSIHAVASPKRYNDGEWHQIVVNRSASTLALYVDGRVVAARRLAPGTAQPTGYWRVGGDTLAGWPAKPTHPNYAGTVDEVATYPAPLTAAQISALYGTSGR